MKKRSSGYLPKSRRNPFCLIAVVTFISALGVVSDMAQTFAPVKAPTTRLKVDPGSHTKAAQRKKPRAVFDLTGLGDPFYSTGLENVFLRIIPVVEPYRTNGHPYLANIYLVQGQQKIRLGSNYDSKLINLGKLPMGEIIIAVESFPAGSGVDWFFSGPGDRNPDKLPHAVVRRLDSGIVDVRFEDSPYFTEMRGMASNAGMLAANICQDTILQFGGGVTGDSALPILLKNLRDETPGTREAAAKTLKLAYPKIAATGGVR